MKEGDDRGAGVDNPSMPFYQRPPVGNMSGRMMPPGPPPGRPPGSFLYIFVKVHFKSKFLFLRFWPGLITVVVVVHFAFFSKKSNLYHITFISHFSSPKLRFSIPERINF